MKIDLEKLIETLIASRTTITAKEVCDELNISQAKFSRISTKIKDKIISYGKGKSTRYAIRRKVEGLGSEFPIYILNNMGVVIHAANIKCIQAKGFIVDSLIPEIKSLAYSDLPYWLDDLRPSGFIGKLIPRKHPELNFPQDVRLWDSTSCIHYWTLLAWDLIGNFIIGEKAYELYLQDLKNPQHAVNQNKLAEQYNSIADEVLSLGTAGSSAGGEQPKFLAFNQEQQKRVLVKFSPFTKGSLTDRRKDLLISEHICHVVLNKIQPGLAAESEIVISDSRLFLEIQRFDRTGISGRRGLISLNALDSQFTGSHGSWREIALELFQNTIISKDMLDNILWRYYFGLLIANNDMHSWNLSFYCLGEKITALAPVYDMLPMFYAPLHEQISDKAFEFKLPPPQDVNIWQDCLKTALRFWQEVSEQRLISDTFRKIAEKNQLILNKQSI